MIDFHPPQEDEFAMDEGGLRPPPGLGFWRRMWWWFDFLILVKLARLRFILILVVIGAVITQWDLLIAYFDKWTRPEKTTSRTSQNIEYFCPMHPAVIRDDPKEKCPICFMPLSKRKKGSGKVEVLPAGVVNRVQLSPYRVTLAGVQTWKVDYQPLAKEIVAIGFVEFDENKQRTVSARFAGRIDKLYASETGRMVKAGDELALLYSPKLTVTIQSLRESKRSRDQDFANASRTQLELLGIDKQQISELEQSDDDVPRIKIHSPIKGHIIKKYVREGQYIEEGTPLYEVADLTTVWIQAQIYEDDLIFLPASLSHGGAALTDPPSITATTNAYGNEPFHGKLTFIYPHVDQETRTATARFELSNLDYKLRPGSTATVTMRIEPDQIPALTRRNAEPNSEADTSTGPGPTNPEDSSEPALQENPGQEQPDRQQPREQQPEKQLVVQNGRVLAVPESAIIDTGSQRIVYRQDSPGVYEGVLVELGPRMTRADQVVFFPVLEGLRPGDVIVTSGSFLVDAETRLNPAAGSIYFGGSAGSQASGSNVTTVRPSTPDDAEAKIAAALAKLAPEDQQLAETQGRCPILQNNRLGIMGTPVRVILKGQPVLLCCSSCRKQSLANPQATLEKVAKLKTLPVESATADKKAAEEKEIATAMSALPPQDRKLATAQRFCAVLEESRLGSMGTPVKLQAAGQTVFICCEGCRASLLADPQSALDRVGKRKP